MSQSCRIFYLLFKMSLGSSTVILLDHREDKCFTGQCSQKIKQVPFFSPLQINNFIFFLKIHIMMLLYHAFTYLMNIWKKIHWNCPVQTLQDSPQPFLLALGNQAEKLFLHCIFHSLSDINIQRTLHTSTATSLNATLQNSGCTG